MQRGGESQTSFEVPAVQLNGRADKWERFREKFVDASLSLTMRACEDVRFIDSFIQEGRSGGTSQCLASLLPLTFSHTHTHTHAFR